MNFVVFKPNEIVSDVEAIVQGERFSFLREHFSLELDHAFPACVLGGQRGTATVCALEGDKVYFKITLDKPAPPRAPCIVIVATPRPPTIEKVVALTTQVGVLELIFFRAEKSEKSYLQSKRLDREALDHATLLGQMQAGDPNAPVITIEKELRSFWEKTLPAAISRHNTLPRYLADTTASHSQLITTQQQGGIIAIGPEQGWSEQEIRRFINAGFTSFSLGERILRVEWALSLALGRFLPLL